MSKIKVYDGSGWVSAIEEAPQDGKQYARKDAAWEEVAAGGGGGGVAKGIVPFSYSGDIVAGTGVHLHVFPFDAEIKGVYAALGTAPTGQDAVFDVNLNGTSIFDVTPANRPTVAAGNNVSARATPDTVSVTEGDYLTIDIDQIGTTTAGADLTVTVEYEATA